MGKVWGEVQESGKQKKKKKKKENFVEIWSWENLEKKTENILKKFCN